MDLRHKSTMWFVLILTAITLVVFWPLYSGTYTLRGEAADLALPVLSHIREALFQYEWPLWNKYQYQGIATSVFPFYWNPVYLLASVLFPSPHLALNAVYLFLIFISGLGFFKLSGLFFTDNRVAAIGGWCYPLAGFFVVQGQYLDLISTAAWLPLLLYAGYRYQSEKQVKYLILLAGSFYLFSTSASLGFVVIVTGIIILQLLYGLIWNNNPKNHQWYTLPVVMGAGFLVWRIYWLRWMHYAPSGDIVPMTSSVLSSLNDLSSLLLPQMTAIPSRANALSEPVHFHSFTGVIVLFLMILALTVHRTTTTRSLGITGLILLILSIFAPVVEPDFSGFTGMSSMALMNTIKISSSIVILLLALHGLQKVVIQSRSGRLVFLFTGLIIGGIAVLLIWTSNLHILTELKAWYIQLDLLKASMFLLITGAILWVRGPNTRIYLLAGLIIAELGISNYLHHDSYLYTPYPSSVFAKKILHPENKATPVDLHAPVGQYSDQDFQIASLDRNTGTLFRKIVRDGYWPWVSLAQNLDRSTTHHNDPLQYPLFYYSMDQNSDARPSYTNFDDGISIDNQTDHQWQLSILTRYEKQLVFNQNYDRNWNAYLDNEAVPVLRTRAGMMSIRITPGLHRITFKYQTDGLINLFSATMIAFLLLTSYLLFKGVFPYLMLASVIPFILTYLFNIRETTQLPMDTETFETIPDSSDYIMDYESHSPFWFLRPGQITPKYSFNGYRSEKLDKDAEYSATLQLHRKALKGKKELEYQFRLCSENVIEAGIVLKTYTAGDEAYNIRYFKSLDNEDWSMVRGRFSLQELPGTLIKADFYIWNNRKQDFLIDDIQVKLNP